MKIQTSVPKDVDSEIAFKYSAMRNQVIDELLLLPGEMAGHIKRAMK